MLTVKIILGSTRQGRFSEKVLPWLQEMLALEKDMQTEVLDLREHALPFFDSAVTPSSVTNGDYGNEAVNAWSKKIKEADAFIIITPEYNHGYSGVLKNALDSIYLEWNKKPVIFISYGGVGGGRVVEQLREVAIELDMVPTRTAVHIQAPWFLMDETGTLKAGALDSYAHAAQVSITNLKWWGDVLKEARKKSA